MVACGSLLILLARGILKGGGPPTIPHLGRDLQRTVDHAFFLLSDLDTSHERGLIIATIDGT